MATLDDDTRLASEVNSENPHDGCLYEHQLLYTLDLPSETLVDFTITDGALPEGLVLDTLSGFISGEVVPLDTYHPVKDYIRSDISSLDDSVILWDDAWLSLDDIGTPLTVGDLKALNVIHYTGKNYNIKGHIAYAKEFPSGDLTKFYFTVTLHSTYDNTAAGGSPNEDNYTSKEFYIQVIPGVAPKVFLINYGNDNNNLVDDDLNILTPEEYILWRESQGHVFLNEC